MENKTSYTLQDAREEVAKEMQGKEFWACPINFKRDIELSNSAYKYYTDSAELYKEKATEELRKENEALQLRLKKALDHVVYGDTEQALLILKDKYDVITQSNKELVEALETVRALIYRKDEEHENGWLCDPKDTDFGSILITIDKQIRKP